jgi:hypothetical protein
MKKKPLRIRLHAREPSVVELTLGDRVQLDRLTPSPRGYVAERHGALLQPGTTTVALDPGHYLLRTLSNAHLRVVAGGVAAVSLSDPKDPWPPPAPLAGSPAPSGGKGDELAGELPSLTLAYLTGGAT